MTIQEFQVHEYNSLGYYTGRSKTSNQYLGIPKGWSKVPLPEIPQNKYAILSGNSWKIVDTFQEPLPEPGKFFVSRWEIPDDGSVASIITFTSRNPVSFIVNDEEYSVMPESGIATLEVFADAVGPIRIEVRDISVIIVAKSAAEFPLFDSGI